jgi:multidrug resistance efflux pump
MMVFDDMTNVYKNIQFFINRPSPAIGGFIITLLIIICGTLVWSFRARMDDVVKVIALIRPSSSISLIKTTTGGEIIEKNYSHDDYVRSGELLLRIDAASDILEFNNSKKLMKRIDDVITVYNALTETIKLNKNSAISSNGEAYSRSEAYLIERNKLLNEIEGLKINLNREKAKHEMLIVRIVIEDLERDIKQAELQFSLWETNQMINAIDNLNIYLQSQENLERRVADLELNIKSATIYAPIDGRISEIRRLNRGDRVLTGEEIINIIPDTGGELKAELYIDPAYIARVQVGQSVSLRFPGLPPSKFGQLGAVISIIPADYTIGIDMKPAFIVEARINQPWLSGSNGEKINLRSGISAEGRVIIDHDTVIRMILRKLDFIL